MKVVGVKKYDFIDKKEKLQRLGYSVFMEYPITSELGKGIATDKFSMSLDKFSEIIDKLGLKPFDLIGLELETSYHSSSQKVSHFRII